MKKFITLMAAAAMTISASAETATFGAANATDKDTAIPCAGFTVSGDYNPGGTSKVNVYDGDKGLKLRANKGAGANELMLSVNEGLTITDLTMGMVVNDANGTFSLSGIAVDGTPVADFSSIALPNTSNAAGKAVVNLSGLNATQNIVFTYDFEGYEGKNKQVYIAGKVTFEEGGSATFAWEPVSLYPQAAFDITNLFDAASVNFQVYEVEGLASTEVMPMWVDEDGNEIKAVSGGQDDWNLNQFIYQFNASDFKANGEYILLFPEGMLVNAAGEKSAKVEIPYTFDVPQLAPAMFDDFKILSINPDLNEPQAIWQDKVITINTNHNEAIGLTKILVNNITTGEYIGEATNYTSYRELGDSSEISFEVSGPWTFFEENTYRAEITFYNATDEYTSEGPAKIVDRVAYEFTGRVEAFKFSSVTLESVTPTPWSMISEPSQAVFTYTFSAPVDVYKVVTPQGMNGQVSYIDYISSNEDKTVWTLDLSKNEEVMKVDTELTIQLYANDLEGLHVKGNFGVDAESCFEYNWNCELGAIPIVVVTPEMGQTIDRLDKVVVKSSNGEPMAWSWMGEANVVNQLGIILGTLVCDEGDGEAGALQDEIVFTKWMDENWNVTPIDLIEEGYYSIMFSAGCFNFGEEFSDAKSKSLTSTFIVSGELEEPVGPGIDPAEQEVFNYTQVDPENGSTVNKLDVIKVYFSEDVALDGCEVVVYNAEGEVVTTGYGDYDWDAFAFDYAFIVLSEPVTASGQYEVVIPARSIRTENFEDGVAGICNPEIKLTYTVKSGSVAVEGVEAADAEGVYYDLTGRRVLNPAKGIYIINGKKVVK